MRGGRIKAEAIAYGHILSISESVEPWSACCRFRSGRCTVCGLSLDPCPWRRDLLGRTPAISASDKTLLCIVRVKGEERNGVRGRESWDKGCNKRMLRGKREGSKDDAECRAAVFFFLCGWSSSWVCIHYTRPLWEEPVMGAGRATQQANKNRTREFCALMQSARSVEGGRRERGMFGLHRSRFRDSPREKDRERHAYTPKRETLPVQRVQALSRPLPVCTRLLWPDGGHGWVGHSDTDGQAVERRRAVRVGQPVCARERQCGWMCCRRGCVCVCVCGVCVSVYVYVCAASLA